MSSFTCCIWWLIFGVLLGWLLSWWLSKCCGKKSCDHDALGSDTDRTSQNLMDSSISAASYTPPSPQPASPPVTSSISRADMIKAAQAAGISFSGRKSDLEIIEGIGPKIAELLNDNGINTFEELSRASIPAINAILENGGDKFRLANPETWAEQAALAAKNQWAELKVLQDSLDGGVRKS